MSNFNNLFRTFIDTDLSWKSIFFCSVLIGVVFWVLPIRAPYTQSDLVVYETALSVVRNGGNPYDPEVMIAHYRSDVGIETSEPGMMWNPPSFFLFPGALLNLPQRWTFNLIPILSLFSAFVFAILGWRFSGTRATLTLRTALVSCISIPLLVQLCISQISALVVLPVVIGSFLFLQRRDLAAGVLLSFAVLKPHLVLLPMVAIGFWSILQRRWQLLTGLLLGSGFSAGLAELVYPNSFLQWLHRPSWPVNLSGAAFPTIIRGSLVNQIGYDPLFLEVLIPLAGVGILLIYLWRCHKVPSGNGLVWAIALNMLSTPYGYIFDQSLGIVVQSFLLAQGPTEQERTLGIRLILLANLIPCLCLVLLPSWLVLWWMSYPTLLALFLVVRTKRSIAGA